MYGLPMQASAELAQTLATVIARIGREPQPAWRHGFSALWCADHGYTEAAQEAEMAEMAAYSEPRRAFA